MQAKLSEIRKEYATLNPEDIKLIDPCMGSGHILVYAFDVLMQIYESAGYSQRDAAKSILEHNIYGLDIDDRAYQLAYFAVMMKARQYNRRILNGENTCHVYAIQESNSINRAHLKYFGAGMDDIEKNAAKMQLEGLLDTLTDAKEYGSILNVESYNWDLLRRFVAAEDTDGQISMDSVGVEDTAEQLNRLIDIGETMARKYDVVVTNPPYAGMGNLSAKVNEFAKENYPTSKSDLSTIFMERTLSMCKNDCYMSMINIPVWMFLTTYEKLRKSILLNDTYVNMLHLGRGIFGSDFGTTAFVIQKGHIQNYKGSYRRLFDKQGAVDSVETKEQWFFSEKGLYVAKQDELAKIPGAPLAYWASKNFIAAFEGDNLGRLCDLSEGIHSRNNDEFLRLWYEACANRSSLSTFSKAKKWYPCNKGGGYRKWYGNNDYVIDWENDGQHIRNFKKASVGNNRHRFDEGITFTTITSAERTFRYSPEGYLYDMAGPTFFVHNKELMYYILAAFSSKLGYHYLSAINPGVSLKLGEVNNFPIIVENQELGQVDFLSKENVTMCKDDWDAFETSWDFKVHPLVSMSKGLWDATSTAAAMDYFYGYLPEASCPLEICYLLWQGQCKERFEKLKANEEELNRIFIDIYGLQDELTPEVEDKDVTVRKADLQRDIKSLLSYAVGCMFGRYSLDVEGLAYAGGEWDSSKYQSYIPDADNVIPITDEEYLDDDIVSRLCAWLKVVYGADTLEANLDYIAKALGNKGSTSREIIRNYFLNDFFKDHCQTYSVTGSGKRPIYWLFDSGKQNGFKALVYLHRYTPDTIGNLRIDYLHKMQRVYESEINRMQDMMDHSGNAREVAAASKRKDKLAKQLKECREYDEKISHLALSRIELDLDDGVKVNYRKLQTAQDGKFYEVLADSKNIMVKEKK